MRHKHQCDSCLEHLFVKAYNTTDNPIIYSLHRSNNSAKPQVPERQLLREMRLRRMLRKEGMNIRNAEIMVN